MNDNHTMNIAYSVNRCYLPYLLISMYSLLTAGKGERNLRILLSVDQDLTREAAGPRKPGEGCSSDRQRKNLSFRETHIPKPGLTFLFPPVLTERRENAVGGTTDGDGNQACFLRFRRLPSVAFSRQPAKTKPLTRWLPRRCSDQDNDLRLQKSLSVMIWVFLDCTELDRFTTCPF